MIFMILHGTITVENWRIKWLDEGGGHVGTEQCTTERGTFIDVDQPRGYVKGRTVIYHISLYLLLTYENNEMTHDG